jgi:hypothetical protein
VGGGGTGQQAYQSHMFGAPSKNTYFQPEPQMYSSRRPVTNPPYFGDPQPSFVHRPFYQRPNPWDASSGAYRTGAFQNDIRNQMRVLDDSDRYVYNPDYIRNPTPSGLYYDGPFLRPMRSGQRRTFRNPPRGVAPNAPPGAYGSWSPGYRPPNPFIPGGYDSYLDPFFGSSGVSDALYGDPYVAPGGGRLGWSPSIQNYLNEYGGSNYTMDTVFNPLFNQQFEIDPTIQLQDESGEDLPYSGGLVSSPGTGGLYNEYESQTQGSFYDMFPQYYDEGRVVGDDDDPDPLGTSVVEDLYSFLTPDPDDSPYDQWGTEWTMTPGNTNIDRSIGGPEAWHTRPMGLGTTGGLPITPEEVISVWGDDEAMKAIGIGGAHAVPMLYTRPENMVNIPFYNAREYGLGYGLGYGPDGNVLNPIEGAQDYFNTSTGSYETPLFNPGGTALYGGPDSEYSYKTIEEWRRLAGGNETSTPATLFGDPGGSNFTGQEWGTTDNPLATSMWAQVYGGKGVAPSERVQDEDDPIYDYLKFESDNLSTQDYGGSPSDWQEIGASSRTGDSWVYEIGGLDPEDENYNPKISRLSSAWGQIDTSIPQLGVSNFSNFIESHVSKTYDQIYNDGVFPDTYDQNLRMTTSLLHDELHQPGWMGETRTVHPAAGKSIESLTESERADLERIIGSEGDYSNFAYAFSPSTFSEGTWSTSLVLLGTGGVGTNLLTGATDQDFFGDVEGLDKVISLSGLSELSEDIGLNEFSSLSRGTRSDPLSSAGGRATGLESAGIEGGNIFGTAMSSPGIGRTKDFEDYLSNYMTDARRAPSAPTRYVGDPGFVVGSPYEGSTLSPGGELVASVPINPDTGMFSSNFFLGENNSLDRFGMGETDNPFVQGFGYEENFSDYVSGELLSNLITGTGNTSRDPSSLILQGDYLEALKAEDPSISAWGAAGGDVQALPDWMSEVPLASEWTPYNPGAPSYLTETESGLPVSQITSIQDLYTDNIDSGPSAIDSGFSTGFYIMQDGGFLSPQPEYASKEPSSDLIDMTVSAVMGEIENPDKVVKEFTAKYGPDALSRLVEDILSGGDGSFLRGPGDGRADDVPGLIDGTEPVFLSSGEYVVPADVVKDLGAGNTDSGAQNLMSMVDEVRAANNGRSAN